MYSRRRNQTPIDAGPSPQPARCWSGPSLRSVGGGTDRDESQATPSRQSDIDDGDTTSSGGSGCSGDVELLPKPTHRGYGSLQKIYPQRTTSHDVDRLRLFDLAVDIFVECVSGSRDQTRMNTQTFRSFVRLACLPSFLSQTHTLL